MNEEERLRAICQAYCALYDNWQEGGSFGRLVERLGFGGKGLGAWEAIQTSGTLTIHNALSVDDESAFRALGAHANRLERQVIILRHALREQMAILQRASEEIERLDHPPRDAAD